jgi:DNA-binding GntR family transcriptional regulator
LTIDSLARHKCPALRSPMARAKTLYPSDRIPLYQQLAEDLRGRISRGEFSSDQRIPSKADLREEYCVPSGTLVSPRTVDSAIQLLKAEGLLAQTPGKRMYILDPAERGRPHPRRRSTDK